MSNRPRVALGIAYFGSAFPTWWLHLAHFTAQLYQEGIDLAGILAAGTMSTATNRNAIVDEFLKGDAEWLYWIDYDNPPTLGGLTRLLGVGKTIVSGLYVVKSEPFNPVAYWKNDRGAYASLESKMDWIPGEIIQIDAAGMGCLLTHRSVYEDIKREYRIFQIYGGGLTTIHKDDIKGFKDNGSHHTDGKVISGQVRLRLLEPNVVEPKFPFFMFEWNRTEDMFFFERAAKCGHKAWLDTSVETAHLKDYAVTLKDWRNHPMKVVERESP